MKLYKNAFILFAIIFLFIIPLASASADEKAISTEEQEKYGILISDKKGTYTWYDLNDKTTGAVIEITSNGKIMLPAWKFASFISDIKYSYNKQTKTMTLKNQVNGKRIVVVAGNSTCMYYASDKAKGVVKDMPYMMYVSKTQNAVMISADTVKLIMNTSGGYKYYKRSDMQKQGFDTYSYCAMFVYNPYNKIESLPKATKVKGLSHTVRVTVPEGYSIPQVFELLVKKGVCSSVDELYEACENYDYRYYPLIYELKDNENRCFRLEGYLFPDTYDFFRLSSGQDAIGRFLRNIEEKLNESMRKRAEELSYTMNEILTIASIIEKEVSDASKMPMIASVIYNRLDKKDKLQMDASIYYVERYIKPNISGDINRYNSYYNTYKCLALPAGPICSPGIKAIKAALYPTESDMLFFCSDTEGNYYFSETYEEHLKILTDIQTKEADDK